MTSTSLETILTRYRRFEECLLTRVELSGNAEATIEFGYIWDDEVAGSAVLADPRPVVLALRHVSAITGDLHLSSVQKENAGRLDWGILEVAQVRALTPESGASLQRLRIEWEDERFLDLAFDDVLVKVE
jgi:hypothetical protein